MNNDLIQMKKLIKLMCTDNLYELNVEDKDLKITIKRKSSSSSIARKIYSSPERIVEVNENQEQLTPQKYMEIKSPIKGIFYRASSTGSSPFVQVGSVVEPGQVVCIVEAMKVMNEIQTDKKCKIIKIMVENGIVVDIEQVLFLIEPA